jgi:hypothetical protein
MKAAIEQHLAELSDEEWATLVARVRPPVEPPITDPTIEGSGMP